MSKSSAQRISVSVRSSGNQREYKVCPVESIYYEDYVPDKWADYYQANVDFFSEIGSPGGAAKMGQIAHDHDLIKSLPPQPVDG